MKLDLREVAIVGQTWRAQNVLLPFDRSYAAIARDWDTATEAPVRTRLGDEAVRVNLNGCVHCWYASPVVPVTSVDLPSWALGDASDTGPLAAVETRVDDEGTSFTLGQRVFTYSRQGWAW